MVNSTDVFVIGRWAGWFSDRNRGASTRPQCSGGGWDKTPIDKPCGEGLMPDGRAALEQLGISIPAETGYSFRGIRFVSGELRVDASFPNGMGQGVRRTILHSLNGRQS